MDEPLNACSAPRARHARPCSCLCSRAALAHAHGHAGARARAPLPRVHAGARPANCALLEHAGTQVHVHMHARIHCTCTQTSLQRPAFRAAFNLPSPKELQVVYQGFYLVYNTVDPVASWECLLSNRSCRGCNGCVRACAALRLHVTGPVAAAPLLTLDAPQHTHAHARTRRRLWPGCRAPCCSERRRWPAAWQWVAGAMRWRRCRMR